MDINLQSVNAAYGAKMYNAHKNTGRSVPADKKEHLGEKVEISDRSSEMKLVKDSMQKSPDIRIEIVEKIKARIETNDYPIENNMDEAVKKLIQDKILDYRM